MGAGFGGSFGGIGEGKKERGAGRADKYRHFVREGTMEYFADKGRRDSTRPWDKDLFRLWQDKEKKNQERRVM